MTMQDRATRALSRVHSVFWRLIASYVVLVFLVAAIVTSVAYIYFQGKYNRELVNFHQLYLKNIEKEIENRVVNDSKLLYMEMAALLGGGDGGLISPENRIADWPGRISSTYVALTNMVARRYDAIEAIHLYYVRENLLVSSTGYQAGGASELNGRGGDWLEALVMKNAKSLWSVYERPAYYGIPAATLFRVVRGYPILASAAEPSVVIGIDYKAGPIREAMARLLPGDSGLTALMSPEMPGLIGSKADMAWDAATEAGFRSLMGEGQAGMASRAVHATPGACLLSAMPLSDSGWYLVNMVASAKLYKRGSDISLVLLCICLAAIVLGIVIASFLTWGIYNPLGQLVSRFLSIFGMTGDKSLRDRDEYEVINQALDGISTRMDELEATIEANRPVIKNELVMRLLEGEWTEPDELRDALSLLDMPNLPPLLVAAIVDLPDDRKSDRNELAESARMLKYSIADELERVLPGTLLAGTMSGTRIGVLVGVDDATSATVKARLSLCAKLIREKSGGGSTISAGPVASEKNMPHSFAVARILADFRFLFPDAEILFDRQDLLDRTGLSAMPDRDFLQTLAACVKSRDVSRFRTLMDQYRQSAREGNCQVAACKADLDRIALALAGAAREQRRQGDQPLEKNLRDLLAGTESLDACLEELSSVVADLCAVDGNPQLQRNALLADRIMAHVRENLAGDLSLDKVGAAVAVSPGYMCKIFKETTGRNFISFVTEMRLDEAARLLSDSRDSVQEIGHRVGFNTPAYFIRLFRSRYGQTPLDYRRSHLRAGMET